jgi:hypothetical protein
MLPYSSSETPGRPSIAYQPPIKPPHKRPAVIIGVILGLIVLAGAAFAVYYIFFRPPLPNISIDLSNNPKEVLVGEPFKFAVAYNNASDQTIKNAVITLTVPEGVAIVGVDPSTRLAQQTVGDLDAQAIGSKTFDLLVTGGENSVKHLSVAFRYRLDDGDAPAHERAKEVDIRVGQSAVSLNLDVPQKVFAEQIFDVGVSYQNNSKISFQNAKLVLEYPQMFQVQGSSSSTGFNDGKWDLGTIAPGGQGEVTLTGQVTSGQQSFFSVVAHLQMELNGHSYDVGAKSAGIAIQTTPLSVSVLVNRKTNYVSSVGDNLSYTLNYRNSSAFALQNVVIKAALEGEMFDMGTLNSRATLNSIDNTLTWNTSNTSALNSVAPGQSGSVEFEISLKKAWPVQNENDKNFAVEVNADIRSLTVPAGITAEQTVSSANIITKIAGQAGLASHVYFKEPGDDALNSGPYPPIANQPTQYTVHWIMRTYSTDLANVRVAATLQSGAKILKVVKTNADTSPIYNSQTGEVTWDIPSMSTANGLVGAPLEAIFQIEATPAVNQVNQNIPLIGATTLTARDVWTGTTIKASAVAKNSSLPDDSQAAGGDRRVKAAQ